jgi:zinc protease
MKQLLLLASAVIFFGHLEGSENMLSEKRVFKFELKNGLNLLVCPKKFAPKVALQMWYHVGSKNEEQGEKGMAHFIEHMVFKGTHEMLSESDIVTVAQKLSADVNAFTSYDYTAYVFDVPVANWDQVLPIFADCMSNCSFKQEHMNSEVKAVIQELKMYNDKYSTILREELMASLFPEHPYHHPIIGYKQDLWNLESETLINFYKKYYVPNNATLVIVGDVDPEETFNKVQKIFEKIPRAKDIEPVTHFINDDLCAKSVVVYRDVQQPLLQLIFLIPGFAERQSYLFDIIAQLLAQGKSSRLYKILVDELAIATSVSSTFFGLADRDVFIIGVQPKTEKDIEKIKQVLAEQIYELAYSNISDQELRRAVKLLHVDKQHLLESVHDQAAEIGHAFLLMGDPEYPFETYNYSLDQIREKIVPLLREYFRPSLCHTGVLLKIADSDREYLNRLQKESDVLDTQILFGKERESEVEPTRYADTIEAVAFQKKSFVKPTLKVLSNGLRVFLYDNPEIDLIECILRYKQDQNTDTKSEQGLSSVVAKMLLEGTTTYPGLSFAQEINSYGISVATAPGIIYMTMPAAEAEKGLHFLSDMLNNAELHEPMLKKIINKTKAQLLQFWDTPAECVERVAAEKIYPDHPYGFMSSGTEQTLEHIDIAMCKEFYDKKLTADGASIALVGNLKKCNVDTLLEKYLSSWRNSVVPDVRYPAISSVNAANFTIEKNRDQVVLAFAGLSVKRMDPDYDALVVFDEILTQGMHSKLFELREQSGLFYSIAGSLCYRAGEQPGMIFIKTMVSNDRLQEAEVAIKECLDTAIDTISVEQFESAKENIVNAVALQFETNEKIAESFLFLEKYKLSSDFFENRIDKIRALQLADVKNIVKKYLSTDKMITVKIGRV